MNMTTNLQQPLLTTTANPFYMTLTGRLERVEITNSLFLVCSDRVQFTVSGEFKNQQDFDRSIQQWEVVPNITSNGLIATIQVMGKAQNDNFLPDRCELIGRVVQLGKRNSSVLFKVSRPPQKTLRLTFMSPLPEMKTGEMWQVLAVRQGNSLQIEYGLPLEEDAVIEAPLGVIQEAISIPPVPSSIEQEVQNNNEASSDATASPQRERAIKNVVKSVADKLEETKTRLFPLVKQALIETTQISGWQFLQPKQRDRLWEWEAFFKESGQQRRARVQAHSSTEQVEVYQYPHNGEIQQFIGDEEIEDEKKSDRLVVTPLGAARSIGASCFRVEIGPYEIVLDAGTRPKGSNPLPAFEHLNNPNLILITHAHQDHIGALPVFHNRFPSARMISTPGTREIAHVMLTDGLKVQQSNEDFEQLFNVFDLEETLFRLETEPVGVDFEPLPGLQVRFIHAGHIVGAACVYLRYGDRSLLYTGDYNTTSSRTTDGLKLNDLPEADILITESTYGADVHPSRKAQETELLQAVAEVVQAGGNVLIPAFALGRAQEILLAIRTSALFHNMKIPVYVDGLVRGVTDVFRDNMNLMPSSLQNYAKQSAQEPFFNPDGTPSIIPITSPKERPLAIAKPSVVIASSGMLTGGASVYYGQALLERENAAIFISGYTDEESPGRFLQGLQKGETIKIEGQELTVRATIRRFNLSAHADRVGLTQVIHKVSPKHLILVHGSQNALHELSRAGGLREKYMIHIPSVGERIEYGTAPQHITQERLTRIERPQEFEIAIDAEVEGAWLRIPESVLEDPRWEMLSATGVLKAKWTGIGLKLSPMSHHAVAVESAIASDEDCCAVCQFFADKRCQCSESPLYERRVDPTAKCFEFARSPQFSDSVISDLDLDLIFESDMDDDTLEM